jgi:hypothetical protein
METEQAEAFTRHWLEAWNAHDLDAILGHFDENVTFTSPLAATLVEGSDGVIRGKDELRAYWSEGLRQNPDLRFELVTRYDGVDTLVINYRDQRGDLACEVLTFVGGLVTEGHASRAAPATSD